MNIRGQLSDFTAHETQWVAIGVGGTQEVLWRACARIAIGHATLVKVIRAFRNHRHRITADGYRENELFQLCGQPFEGSQVRFLRLVQGGAHRARLREVPLPRLRKNEEPHAVEA